MTYFNLFFVFFKVGLFSFGGGYAILPLMQHEVVDINKYNFIVPIIVAILIRFFGVSPIVIIIATMIIGNIFYMLKEKKEDDKK